MDLRLNEMTKTVRFDKAKRCFFLPVLMSRSPRYALRDFKHKNAYRTGPTKGAAAPTLSRHANSDGESAPNSPSFRRIARCA